MLAQHAQGPGFNLSSLRKQNQTKNCNNYCWLGCLERGRAAFLVWEELSDRLWLIFMGFCSLPPKEQLFGLPVSLMLWSECFGSATGLESSLQGAGHGVSTSGRLRQEASGRPPCLTSFSLPSKLAKFPPRNLLHFFICFYCFFFSNAWISYRKCVRDVSVMFCTRLCPRFRTLVIPATGDWLFVSWLPDKWSTF